MDEQNGTCATLWSINPHYLIGFVDGKLQFSGENLMMYRVYANKTQDLISARKFAFWDFS